MSINSEITLTRGATSITLYAPGPGYPQDSERAQGIGRDATGGWWVYDKSVSSHKVTYVCIVTAAQRADLDDFFHGTVVGAKETFTLVDHRGVSHAASRFAIATLVYTKTPGARYSVVLEIAVADEVG